MFPPMKRDALPADGLRSWHAFESRMDAIKNALWCDGGAISGVEHHMLRLALNEAEALAWLTPFPYLLFPLLAEEKVAAFRQWAAHQQEIQYASPLPPPRARVRVTSRRALVAGGGEARGEAGSGG